MTTATEVIQKISDASSTNKPDIRHRAIHEVGTVDRQGDIYIWHVPADFPHGEKRNNRQIAIGSTQGSRHIAELGDIFDPPENAWKLLAKISGKPEIWTRDRQVLIGPVIISPTRWTISHPEHGHIDEAPGTFLITYQRDYRKELEAIRRVQD